MRISDWSSDVCSSDLPTGGASMEFRASPISPTLVIVRILACAMACMLATGVAWAGPSDVTDPEAPRSLPADGPVDVRWTDPAQFTAIRSEEHTSELQSLMRLSYAVFCLNKKHHTI